ncbi:hypothetical protein [Burkholderia cenocepacia]|uniref:hypothetical protein n=1 Tax=Burkholderia cenocepacia TaxID=95486 RepID=UPI001CF14BFE|nr:hypothetical protein [Burkholderia cenocepacia]MCA8082727.1 hypothetical protein [Burkholderia cenocepacia]
MKVFAFRRLLPFASARRERIDQAETEYPLPETRRLESESLRAVACQSLSEVNVRAAFAVRKVLLDGSDADVTIRERVAVGADPWLSCRNWSEQALRQACWHTVLRYLPDDVQQHFVELGLAESAVLGQLRDQ